MSNLCPTTDDYNGVRDSVVRLRCMGFGKERIAKELGLAYKKIDYILRSEFQNRFADREELKQQTAFQLDWLARPLMEKYEAAGLDADRRDAEAILKIIERKCRLLGLDEAVKLDVRQVEQYSDEELDRELSRYGIVKQLTVEPGPPQLPETVPDADFTTTESPDELRQPLQSGTEVRETELRDAVGAPGD